MFEKRSQGYLLFTCNYMWCQKRITLLNWSSIYTALIVMQNQSGWRAGAAGGRESEREVRRRLIVQIRIRYPLETPRDRPVLQQCNDFSFFSLDIALSAFASLTTHLRTFFSTFYQRALQVRAKGSLFVRELQRQVMVGRSHMCRSETR